MDPANVAELHREIHQNDTKSLWVFGYGSLCWKPGFAFHKVITGYVKGYQRRFWQGNSTHRGTDKKPGRVATLVDDQQGIVHGVAFAVKGDAAVPYLNNRECKMGSYITRFALFYPPKGEPFNVLLYVAMPNNPLWLGDRDLKEIADEVVGCSGASGSNVEYVLRLANFMRELFPHHRDPHLFDLEEEVLRVIEHRRMCLKTLMGNGEGCITFVEKDSCGTDRTVEIEQERTDSSKYTSRIQAKKLRCLNL